MQYVFFRYRKIKLINDRFACTFIRVVMHFISPEKAMKIADRFANEIKGKYVRIFKEK